MSIVPTSTLPKCTRTVVIDLLFMRKYQLTHSQMIVMYYLLMLKNWVKFVNNDYYVIISRKIEDDLEMHQKTVEASITQLKKLNLIDTKRCEVEEWNNRRTYRAITITSLGKEYNLSYYKEEEYQNSVELEKENEIFRVENDRVHSENMELENINRSLELKNRTLNIQLEGDEAIFKASIEALEKIKDIEEKCKILEMENREYKEREEKKEKENKNSTPPTEEREKDMDNFRKKITIQYSQSGKAICNAVQNSDNWSVDTSFHINSYNRLSIYLPDGKAKQISEPKQVNKFWEWLFSHQHRVGKPIDSKRVADISTLLPFKGAYIYIEHKSYKIHYLKAVMGGVKVILLDENSQLINMANGHGSTTIDVKKCKDFFKAYYDNKIGRV